MRHGQQSLEKGSAHSKAEGPEVSVFPWVKFQNLQFYSLNFSSPKEKEQKNTSTSKGDSTISYFSTNLTYFTGIHRVSLGLVLTVLNPYWRFAGCWAPGLKLICV